MNELSSVRWTRFADVLTRFASEFPKTLEEIQAEHKARTEIEQQRNRLLQEQNALLRQLITEVSGLGAK